MHHFKLSALQRFFLVVLVIAGYFAFTVYSYGLAQGIAVTALTWAFFVFATPIADGGFVLAFPIRLITGFRMLYTQIIVWIVGVILVASYMLYSPNTFSVTPLLELFYAILTNPWPLGIILLLSALGTFISIRFEDDVVDVVGSKHKKADLAKKRKQLYLNLGFFIATIVAYVLLLNITGTDIAFL